MRRGATPSAAVFAAVVLLCVLPAPVHANPVEDVCSKGEALAKAGKYHEAASHYAKVLAAAHKKGALFREQTLAASMRRAFAPLHLVAPSHSKYTTPPPTGIESRVIKRRVVMRTLIEILDPEHRGAHASAYHYAVALLQDATREGRPKWAPKPAAVVVAYAKARRSGKHARTMKGYAQGLTALASGDLEAAADALQASFDVMLREAWRYDALFAGTELASVRLRLGQPEAAAKTMEAIAAFFAPKDNFALFRIWHDLTMLRLLKAPAAVLAPFHSTSGPGWPPGSMSGEPHERPAELGGRALVDPGQTGLGRAYARLRKKRKPLVTVRRGKNAFEIDLGFDLVRGARGPAAPAFSDEVRHRQGAGIGLGFWQWSVAVDFLALRDAPHALLDDHHEYPSPWRPYYRLAKGERWSVDPRGEVSIQ